MYEVSYRREHPHFFAFLDLLRAGPSAVIPTDAAALLDVG
jgi:hypothetical protein